MWSVLDVLVLVLCIPGPLGPGVLIAKTSFGHKMAEAGGDPGAPLPVSFPRYVDSSSE